VTTDLEDVLTEYRQTYDVHLGFSADEFAAALTKVGKDPDRLADGIKEFCIRAIEHNGDGTPTALRKTLRHVRAMLHSAQPIEGHTIACRVFGVAAEYLGVQAFVTLIDVLLPPGTES
jgi:hypothetical protein